VFEDKASAKKGRLDWSRDWLLLWTAATSCLLWVNRGAHLSAVWRLLKLLRSCV